jgi:acetyl esterase/lipase
MENSPSCNNKYLHFFIRALVIANCASILLGLIYIITKASHGLWNIYGVLLLITLLGNVTATLFQTKYRSLDYIYLLLTIISMMLLPVLNRSASEDVLNTTSRSVISITLLLSLLVLGGVIAVLKLRPIKKTDEASSHEINHTLRITIQILLSASLVLGIYLAYQLITGRSADKIEMVLPTTSLFLSIIFFTISMLILKLLHKKTKAFVKATVIILGLSLTVIFSLPLVLTLATIQDVESNYMKAFGVKSADIIPAEKKQYFTDTPFVLPDYFFGAASGDHRVKQDILYFEGTTGIDKGIRLHFDAYMPPKNDEELPGNHSVLIRIHGGAWTAGDKGHLNRAQINKHFASLGYVVFDVQHGLSNEERLFQFLEVPANKVAGFSVDNMVRHIGHFTDYLAEHHDEYGANLDSVFISGRSSGGQIANAVGLGSKNRQHNVLNPHLTIKGIISVYPANGLSKKAGIEGTREIIDPSLLVTEDSPPALIYQGTHDGFVDQSVSKKFNQTYSEKSKSALILLPLAGHASNTYFSGYYNQVFMYYMERFMYQHQ